MYQLDQGCKRLLCVRRKRTEASLSRFFSLLDAETIQEIKHDFLHSSERVSPKISIGKSGFPKHELRLLSLVELVNPSTYHRLLSHRPWPAKELAKLFAHYAIKRFAPDGFIKVVGDETVDGHRGKKVYGKARHRDAVRSSHSHTVFRYGHKWIVLAILIELPYTRRPFALPVLVALYRDKNTCTVERRRHKTAIEIMRGLLVVIMQWFPERKFIFAGNNAYGTHAMARFAARYAGRLTLVSKIVVDVNLFAHQ